MAFFQRARFFIFITCLFLSGWAAPKKSLEDTQAITTSICAVQGSGFSSPLQGRTVKVNGIVTANFAKSRRKGFFLQLENCDKKPATSDGIFVFLMDGKDVVSDGDRVKVQGLVQEYYGMTEIHSSADKIEILSQRNTLPTPIELTPPLNNYDSRVYFESLEGMRVSLAHGRVIGPTDVQGRTWFVQNELSKNRVFFDDPDGTGEIICVDNDGLAKITPDAQVGEEIQALTGVFDYRIGVYCVELTSAPGVMIVTPQSSPDTTSNMPVYSLATFNLKDLFDTIDDPLTDDVVLSNQEYQRRLEKHALAISQPLEYPGLLAVQEVENANVLHDLIFRPEIKIYYESLIEEGPDVRGIDLALLYRPDLVTILETHSHQGCTGLLDGLEPDGNDDPERPTNVLTCDRNGDGVLDGNRLFSRPPLMTHLLLKPVQGTGPRLDFWVIVCHFKSKVGDTSSTQYTLPRRTEQAQFIVGLVQQIRQSYPQSQLVVLGDFNDYPSSPPLQLIRTSGVISAMGLVERESRYSYIYQGVSQYLDDIYFTQQLSLLPARVGAIHINADYPHSLINQSGTYIHSSDHDPVRLDFGYFDSKAFLPLVAR